MDSHFEDRRDIILQLRKLKGSTSEPLETTSSALEMQPSPAGLSGGGGNTVILNPALHSAAGLTKKSSLKTRKATRPPALNLGKEPVMMTDRHAGPGISPSWKVTFPDIEIHSPKDEQPDNLSISSRGTSSTMGYR